MRIFFVLVYLFVALLPLAGATSHQVYAKSKSTKKSSTKKSTKKSTRKSSSSKKKSRSRRHTTSKSRHKAAKPKPAPKPAPPSPEELAAKQKRESNYSNLNSSFKTYDAALAARTRGDYHRAAELFNQALEKIMQSRDYQKGGNAGTMAAMTYFELGKTQEASGDLIGARDSYAKCLRIMPEYAPASVNMIELLAKNGQIDLALAKAREAVRENGRDPRSRLLLSLLLQKKGDVEAARREQDEFKRLLSVDSQIIPKQNAHQKNVVRVADYLRGVQEADSKDDQSHTQGKDETDDDDGIEEEEGDTEHIDAEALKKHDQKMGD